MNGGDEESEVHQIPWRRHYHMSDLNGINRMENGVNVDEW